MFSLCKIKVWTKFVQSGILMVIRLMINYFINLKKEAKNANAGISGAIFSFILYDSFG